MLSLYDAGSIKQIMGQALYADLRAILADRLELAATAGLQDLTQIVVVQPNDTIEDLTAEIGFSPLINPIDGIGFGQKGFLPYWAWLTDLGGWYELIHTIGDSGFAVTLLVEKAEGVPTDLLAMCSAYLDGTPCA